MKRWIYKNLDENVIKACAQTAQVPYITAEVLMSRGYDDAEKIADFLNPCEITNPYLIKDMDKAVSRIRRAVEDDEKIAIFGDYDCDGVTATYILYNYLCEIMGADVTYYIPSRSYEGYGLNIGAIDKLYDEGVSLIVTVDNGISAIKEADYATQKGIDLVITDHHKPIDVLPNAVAVVNPHRVDCTSGLTYLCGAGIALKLVCALEEDIDMIMDYYSQIAMLGTIADVVPIIGENRTILNTGLEGINNTENFGLSALMEKSCQGKQIAEEDVAFSLVPKINAAGRLGCADDALLLLLSEDEDTAKEYAEKISQQNDERKAIEQQIYDEAIGYINENPAILNERIIIIAGENWHNGVSGIVSARLCTLLQKPVILISSDGDEARGSGRSIGNFSLHRMLCHCSDLLTQYGGHVLAAGLTLASENIDAFIKRATEYANQNYDVMPTPEISIDAKVEPTSLGFDTANALNILKPFGAENRTPILMVCDVKIIEIQSIGEGKHIRLKVQKGDTFFYAVYFKKTRDEIFLNEGDTADLAVHLSVGEWRGKPQVSVIVEDIHAKIDVDEFLLSSAVYDKFNRAENLTESETNLIFPTRDDTAVIYRYIRKKGALSSSFENMAVINNINYGKTRIILDVLAEHELISQNWQINSASWAVINTDKKVDLNDSTILSRLSKR